MANNRNSYGSRFPAHSSSRRRDFRHRSISPSRRIQGDGYRDRSQNRRRDDDRHYSPPPPRRLSSTYRPRSPSPPRHRDRSSRRDDRNRGTGPQQNPREGSRSNVNDGSQNVPKRQRLSKLDSEFQKFAYCLKCSNPNHWQSFCKIEQRQELPARTFGLEDCAWSYEDFELRKDSDISEIDELVQHVYQASLRLHSYDTFVTKRNALLLKIVKQSANDPKVDPRSGREGQLYPSPHIATVYEVFVAKSIRTQNKLFKQCWHQLKRMYDKEIAGRVGFKSHDPHDPNKPLTHSEKNAEVSRKIFAIMGQDNAAWPDDEIESSYREYIDGVTVAFDQYQTSNAELQQAWETASQGLKMWKTPLTEGRQVFSRLPFEHLALKLEQRAEYTLPTLRCPEVESLAHYIKQEADKLPKSGIAPPQPAVQNQAELQQRLQHQNVQLQHQNARLDEQVAAFGRYGQMLEQLFKMVNQIAPLPPADQNQNQSSDPVPAPGMIPWLADQHGHPVAGPQPNPTRQNGPVLPSVHQTPPLSGTQEVRSVEMTDAPTLDEIPDTARNPSSVT